MPGELFTVSTQIGKIFHTLGGSSNPSEAVHQAMLQIAPLKSHAPIKADLERVERNLNVPHDPEAVSRARRILLQIEGRLIGQGSLPEKVVEKLDSQLRNEGEISREEVLRAHRWVRGSFISNYMDAIGEPPVLGARHARWPLLKKAPVFSAAFGRKVYTKNERLQPIDSFKIFGAGDMLICEKIAGRILKRKRRPGGNSHGNAAGGVVREAKNTRQDSPPVLLNLSLHVSDLKYAQCREMGAEVQIFGEVFEDGEEKMRQWAAQEPDKRLFVPAYNHILVVAGQGAIGEEIREEMAAQGCDEFVVVVPFGGGGLIAGIGLALSETKAKVIGVSSDAVPFGYLSFKQGKIIHPSRAHIDTAAPGTQLLDIGEAGFPYILKHVEDVVLIPEDRILAGIAMYHDFGETIEGAGVLAGAALMFGYLKSLNIPENVPVVIVESGGNIDDDLLHKSIKNFGGGGWMSLLPPEYGERLAKFLSNP
jgi:threonine dehydratase